MLKVRGVVDLPPEEELDGVDDSMGVHVWVWKGMLTSFAVC